VFSIVPDYVYFSLYLGYIAGAIAYHRSNTRKVKKTSDRKKVKVKNEYTKGKFIGSAVIVAAVVVAVFIGGRLLLNAIGITRTTDLNDFRKDLVYTVEDITDYITGFDRDGSMREGKLYNVGTRQIKDRHYFTLEMSTADLKKPIYYKGYSGAVYENNEWKQIENYDDYKTLFRKLESTQINVPSVQGDLIMQSSAADSAGYVMSTISKLRRKKDYTYNAYFSHFDMEKYSTVYDQYMKPNDKNSYTFDSYTDTSKLYLIQSGMYNSENFQNLWAQYCNFVKKEYTNSTPSDDLVDLINSLSLTNKEKSVDRIRAYFEKNTKSENKVVNVSKNEDFIDQFLFETGEGYCTHYATTAVVMLQAKGIPARYCEGYLITPKRFEQYAKKDTAIGFSTIDVTDRFAHAWVEVFDETFGWIPVDVTPGFYSTSFEKLMQNLKNQAQNAQNAEEIEEEGSGSDQELIASDTPEQMTDQELTVIIPEEEEATTPTALYVLIGIAAAIVLLILLDALWLVVAVIIRKMLIYSRDRNKSIKNTYRYFIKLLKFEKIDISRAASYENAVDIICEKSICNRKEELLPVCKIILKNGYSIEGASDTELDNAVGYVVNYGKRLQKQLGFGKKLKFMFIFHLTA
ncbi:MAG: transglutaminase domain-containing protein, partial [Oscillospiraceae bacterium]|nr:transglutaminase domain-containing protein [Candidatus Equicaccousia limihippi]